MEQDNQRKKRTILQAAVLLLLVMSLMGNVLLYTKHIEHTRGKAVDTGQSIFDSFKDGQSELEYWSGIAGQIGELASSDGTAARLSAGHLGDALLQSRHSGMAAIMQHAAAIGGEAFSDAPAEYVAAIEGWRGSLLAIEEGEGPLRPEELSDITALLDVFIALKEPLDSFPYVIEESRNALYRLSGGHEWLELAQRIQALLQETTP
ncbi:hypothetical protein [Paenibacillus sp. PL2-23]|uniref:hypothetical protein n=1 Tax=Paenibacillus sp. PL2-23 TaxID=2100729 RepID=UPI0030F97E7F